MQKKIRNIFQKLNGHFYWKEEMLKDAEVLNIKNQWFIKTFGLEVHFSTRTVFYASILYGRNKVQKKIKFLEKMVF